MGGYRPASPHTGRQLNSLEMRCKRQGGSWQGRCLTGLFDSRQTRAVAAAAVTTGRGHEEEDLDMGVGKERGERRGRREKVASQFIHLYIHKLAAFWLGKERPPENYAMVSLRTPRMVKYIYIYLCMLFITVKYSHQ